MPRALRLVAVTLLVVGAASCTQAQTSRDWDALTQHTAALYRAGQYAQGVVVAQQALEVAEQENNPEHLAASLNNLAALYDTQGLYAQAEPLFKRSLAIREQALGPDHPDVAASLHNLAALYRATGRAEEAKALEDRAARIRASSR